MPAELTNEPMSYLKPLKKSAPEPQPPEPGSNDQPINLIHDTGNNNNSNPDTEPQTVEEWAALRGITQHPGEHDGAFQLRVVEERRRWLAKKNLDGEQK